MGVNTNIEWCDATFNPWRGCTKVSAGCTNCYAETLSHRNPGTLGIWGDKGTRVVASEAMWRQPLKWDREASDSGVRRRVFCASLADVFEDRDELTEHRARLWQTILYTPSLDWLLLTKRPENVIPALKKVWDHQKTRSLHDGCLSDWIDGTRPPANVWLGTSVENQEAADARVPRLLDTPAAVRFLSMEPLLGPVDLNRKELICETWRKGLTIGTYLDWVIVGGESGPKARPMNRAWVRDIRDQCQETGVAFHFKQWGEWEPAGASGQYCFNPGASIHDLVTMNRVGKKAAGRMLDGRTWDEFPLANNPVHA